MKLKTFAATVVLAASAFACQAQTNLVASLSFHLIGNRQGPATDTSTTETHTIQSATFINSDLLQNLGASTGHSFSSSAQVLRVIPIVNGANGSPTIIVRDIVTSGKTKTTNVVDVTSFFLDVVYGTVLTNTVATKGSLNTDTTLSFRGFVLTNSISYPALSVTFAVAGSVISKLDKITLKDGLVVYGDNSTWTVAGTGFYNGAPVVIGPTETGGTSTLTVTTLGVFVGPGY
jgi:hypothetical protein